MFKIMLLCRGLKALFGATYKEIDLAQLWRQKITAKEVSGREERHQ
jgi:DNA-binding CsgD family transcriptional regulator